MADVSAPLPADQLQPATPGTSAAPVVSPNPAPTTNPDSQLPTRPQIPDNKVKTSGALGPQEDQQIDTFIQNSVIRLTKGVDPQTVADARIDLIAGAANPNPQTASSAPYLTRYLASLAKALLPTVQHGSLNQRVNCGIVLSRVADNVVNAQMGSGLSPLFPLMTTLMRDPSQAVALWGMKAAAVAINATPGAPPAQLMNEVIPCVRNHGYGGAITDAAYSALSDADPQSIAGIMEVYRGRTALYAKGVPPEPSIDWKAASHLTTKTGMWGKMSQEQQDKAMNLIRENLTAASKAIVAADATPDLVGELIVLISKTGEAVEIAARDRGQTNLERDAHKLGQISSTILPSEVAIYVQPVTEGMLAAFPSSSSGAVNPTVAKP